MGSAGDVFITFASLATFELPFMILPPILISELAGLAEHTGELATSKLMMIVVISFVFMFV